MYEYRNIKTGEIVVTSTKVSGGNWEPVEQEAQEESGQEQETEQPKASRRKK